VFAHFISCPMSIFEKLLYRHECIRHEDGLFK